MYIGDIYLPILSSIDKKSVSKITKEIAGINAKEPRTVSIRRNLQPITLEGYLYNDGEKDDAQYAEDVEALQYRSAGYCYTKYADLDGFIEIENAEAPQTSEELGVRNYTVEGKYLPASKYERVVEVETEMRGNKFNIVFPPHVALPVGATNVRVKTSQDSVKLSAPAFMAGDIPIYRPFPAFYPDDVTHSAGDTPKYDTTAYKMSYNLLDAKDESISYTFVSGVDVPLGSYRVVLRMKSDATIASDARIVVLSGDNVVVDSLHTLVGDNVWNIVKSASFNITQRGITYTIKVSKAEADVANLAVNYGFLLPDKRARVAFDVAAEYDVGECKVFDTITTDSEESTWIQVFNPEHDFAGDIVVQNSMFRWVIKQTAWKDATKVYNIFGSAPVEIGKLYNKAFGDDTVAIKFKEIKPNYLKFTFELDTGNATSESTSAKEIDTVEITPFNVVIDKDVIGAYKDHYTFESTPVEMIEYENGVIAGINSNSIYGLIKSVNVTSSYDGDIIETTGSESSDSYVVPFVIPCEITSYLYKQAADLVISKDNGDVERKFWKDDFSVNSSSQYTGDVADFTWDTANKKLTFTNPGTTEKYIIRDKILKFGNKFHCVISATGTGTKSVYMRFLYIDYSNFYEVRVSPDNYIYLAKRVAGSGENIISSPVACQDGELINITVDFDALKFTVNSTTRDITGYVAGELPNEGRFMFNIGSGTPKTFDLYEYSYPPSISYADDFSTDTTERYQAVTGTVAYNNTNKRMNVTTATGANGKASGRLKSYKFCEGAQQFDVTLPVGDSGDFICMVTHATDPAMTNGIGVGLQSDGAGNWNLVTLSGTTVTVGASSGLTDGKTARIEIEKDITGAYWYYIYDAAGTKPTTPTGKLFTTLSEGYTGWYANGNSKTYALDNISIRAESIVGRTNVKVTEPFWFRDDFGEDSIGRYAYATSGTSFKYDGVNNECYINGRRGIYITDHPTFIGETIVTIQTRNTGVTTDCYPCVVFGEPKKIYGTGTADNFIYGNPTLCVRFSPDGVDVFQNGVVVPGATSTAIRYQSGETQTFVVTYNGSNQITVSDGTNSITFTDNAFAVRTVFSAFIGTYSTATASGVENRFKLIEISGTRVYNKPIHRGAMLETYHDGTQEVVGTTFIDDCQWDRSGEYTKYGNVLVHDTVNACIKAVDLSFAYPKTGKVGKGLYFFNVKVVSPRSTNLAYPSFVFGMQSLVSSLISDECNGYCLELQYNNGGAGTFCLRRYVAGIYTNIATASYTMVLNTQYTIQVVWIGTTINIYVNGIYLFGATDSTYSDGYFGIYDAGSSGTATYDCRYSNIGFVAASPDATNGIAACIPPIGGGARYGVEESVYNTFTTENVNKGVYLTTAKVKTTNPNADEVSLEYTNDTTSNTLNTTPIDVDATYTVKTAPITIDANETDTLRVSVKNSTTCDQSATYVDSLSLIPVSGDDVLYPQDLAFISGVKPSQKRKVEVK